MPHMIHSFVSLLLALLTSSLAGSEWQVVDSLPATKTGGVWCLPSIGRVIVYGDGKLWSSDDAGASWQERERVGARFSYTGMSASVDAEHGRIACFFAGKTPSRLSLDGGETWQPIQALSDQGLSWGSVAWAEGAPFAMLCREHHAKPQDRHWYSADDGQHWRELGANLKAGREQPRLCIWDRNTLLRASEVGIERSTDAGDSWQLISDLLVNACTGVRYGERLFWTAQAGLLVSDDAGASWRVLGASPPDPAWGPYFGNSVDDMVVVTADCYQRSHDGGQSWQQLAAYPDLPDAYQHGEWNRQCRYAHHAYDPVHQRLFAAGLFGKLRTFSIP